MRRTTLALILTTIAATSFAAQAPGSSMAAGQEAAFVVEGRSADISAQGQTTTAHGVQAINDATAAAVVGALQTRFTGQVVEFQLGDVRSERVSLRDMSLHGNGSIRFGQGAWMPVQFDALYDTETQSVEGPAIVLGGSATGRSAKALPLADLQLELARRLGAEFASQSVTFDLQHTSIVGGDGRRVIVHGNGVAEFGEEGLAPVQVQATYDKASQRWVDASYEFVMADGAKRVAAG